MTALKPREDRHVHGVSSERYPINPVSSKPDSLEPTDDCHHLFPRSQIGNDSWFVEIEDEKAGSLTIPHVTGLSRSEHEDVEQHRAWIKLEDGVFSWYDRTGPVDDPDGELDSVGRYEDEDYLKGTEWSLLGPLNP